MQRSALLHAALRATSRVDKQAEGEREIVRRSLSRLLKRAGAFALGQYYTCGSARVSRARFDPSLICVYVCVYMSRRLLGCADNNDSRDARANVS